MDAKRNKSNEGRTWELLFFITDHATARLASEGDSEIIVYGYGVDPVFNFNMFSDKNLDHYVVNETSSIRETLDKITKWKSRVVMVVDKNQPPSWNCNKWRHLKMVGEATKSLTYLWIDLPGSQSKLSLYYRRISPRRRFKLSWKRP